MGCEHEVQLEHSKWLERLEARTKSNTHRIDDITDEVKEIKDITAEIRTIAISMKAMQESMLSLEDKVEKLERAEGEKLKDLIDHAIKVGIGVLLGVIGREILINLL